MATFKCKMCGGSLEIATGTSVIECEYCGTQQTLPRLDDERMANLYDRANHFRRNNEFDKAMGIYEQILNEDGTDSEAYWSLVLCRYGIEYVEDPTSHKRIPTVNRAQFTAIFDDDNYRSALENADSYQRTIYEDEAKAINEIQKGILAISQKEEPFDVFICYKETDNNGRRTHDSVLATELYHELTRDGFKVFFSRITLEDKLGSAYEPYIFAALNSAKVMVVLGTRAEYFNAVWVKNEWSRYLALIKQGQKKMLIPAYKDMDPYDLPEEFSHLQAQDMSKLGFMQDLIRGIKKIAQADDNKTTVVKETVISGGNANTAPLLKRVFMFLEDGDWNSANEYCEKVLDIDPENAEAYLGKLLSEMKVKKQELLKDQAQPFNNYNNYQKAIRFADEKLKNTLTGYIEHINTRNEKARLEGIYTRAKNAMSEAITESAYKKAAQLLESISKYKDSASLSKECIEKAEEEKKIFEKCNALFKEYKETFQNEDSGIEKNNLGSLKNNWKGIDDELFSLNEKLKSIKSEIDSLNNENTNLGFFAGKRKKEIAERIALLENNQKSLMSDITSLQEKKRPFIRDELIQCEYGKDLLYPYRKVKVGEYISFGTYEQDKYASNNKKDIKWLVLEVRDGKALVVSKYGLECKPYNTKKTRVTWETCSLRKWLNDEFINSAFSPFEKAMIPMVTVSADKSPKYKTNPGKATRDQVFLLSIAEANKYFSSDSARQCKPTDYAVANGAYVNSNSGNCWWWLRSPSGYQYYAAFVYYDGYFYESGSDVINGHIAVRPALWIDLNS